MPYKNDPRLKALQNNPKAYQNMYDQIAQVEGMYNQRRAEGMSREDALTTAYTGDELRQRKYGIEPGTYTVKSGDTVASVADSLKTTPDALLQNNPEVTKIQTGLVLNTPTLYLGQGVRLNNGKIDQTNANFGGGGGGGGMGGGGPTLPKAQYLGQGVTLNGNKAPIVNNQVDPRTGLTRGVGAPASAFTPKLSGLAGWFQNAFANHEMQLGLGLGNTTSTISQPYRQPTTPYPNTNVAPNIVNPNGPQKANYKSLPSHQTESRYVEDMFARTANGYTPNQGELNYLLATNRISASPYAKTPTPAYAASSFYSKKKKSGGGGGGGVTKNQTPSKYSYQDSNQPAFSGGGGFRGLVNWRI